MEKFETYTGVAAPLQRSNVDTDQIIPAVYLKRVTRTGFEDGLFAGWREDPEFLLNQPAYKDSTVLIAGPDFGTGSSREHAVWALMDYGFKAVFSSRFADIFRGNAGKAGLLAGLMEQSDIELMWKLLEEEPGKEATVSLEDKTVTIGAHTFSFDVDDYTKWRLEEGLDDIGLTLRDENLITEFEKSRPAFKPRTLA